MPTNEFGHADHASRSEAATRRFSPWMSSLLL